MAIGLVKFHLILFLFNLNFLLFCHGMNPEQQKDGAKRQEQLPIKSLSANADPFTPPSVIAKEFNLPDDLYDGDDGSSRIFESPRQKDAFSDRMILEGDSNLSDYWTANEQNPHLMHSFLRNEQQQQQTYQHNYDPFSESSGSGKFEDSVHTLRADNEGTSDNQKPLKWEELSSKSFDGIQLFQNFPEQKEKQSVTLGGNVSKDGSSIAESPDIPSWAQVTALNVGQTVSHQHPKQLVGIASKLKGAPIAASKNIEPKKHQNKQQRKFKGMLKQTEIMSKTSGICEKGVKQGVSSPGKTIDGRMGKSCSPQGSSQQKSFGGMKGNKSLGEMTGGPPQNPFEVLKEEEEQYDENDESGDSAAQLEPPSPSAAVPVSPSSVSVSSSNSLFAGVSDDKGKAMMTIKIKENEFNEIFYDKVKSIAASIKKLKVDKIDCLKIKDEQAKKKKVLDMMRDYAKIIQDLNIFSRTYHRMNNQIMHIGAMFEWMNVNTKANKASLVDNMQLLRIMQESLVFLDEYLGFSKIAIFGSLFESIVHLKKILTAYDEASTEVQKAKLIEWYEKHVRVQIYKAICYLHLGVVDNVKLAKNTVYIGLSDLSMALPRRKYQFLQVKQAVDKYMDIVFGPQEVNQENSKMDRELEKPRKEQLPQEIERLITDMEGIMDKIKMLEEGNKKILFETDHPEKRLELKRIMKDNYQSVMEMLTRFASKYGNIYGRPSTNVFFVDIIAWIVKIYKYKGLEKADESDLSATMKICLACLQGNKQGEEDVTNFALLVEDIVHLKEEANNCNTLAKSVDGYREPIVRTKLKDVHDYYLQIVEPQLREAFGYLFIGIERNESGKKLTRKQVLTGLVRLSKMAEPKHSKELDLSLKRMNAFYMFSDIATANEISDNLTNYLAKMFNVDFVPENGTDDLEKFAAKLGYPQIYEDALKAIDELLNAKEPPSAKEEENSNINSTATISSSKDASSSKGKKKVAEKKKKSAPALDCGPVDDSNWKTVLEQAKKRIRYVYILVMIQEAEKNGEKDPEKMVFDRAVYLRVWTILFRDEFPVLFDEWKNKYFEMKKKDLETQKVLPLTVVKFYSDGIFNFLKSKENVAKGKLIQEALKQLGLLQEQYEMVHRAKHLFKWMYPADKHGPDMMCVCKKYEYLTKGL